MAKATCPLKHLTYCRMDCPLIEPAPAQ